MDNVAEVTLFQGPKTNFKFTVTFDRKAKGYENNISEKYIKVLN